MELDRFGLVMGEERLVAVDHLQQQEIGDLRDAGGAGRGDARGQGFAPVMQKAAQLRDEAGERRLDGAIEAGRNVLVVEDHGAVGAHLDDAREAQRDEASALAGF
jgi:hypothetical protein